jgi:FkbM family methyltransferase
LEFQKARVFCANFGLGGFIKEMLKNKLKSLVRKYFCRGIPFPITIEEFMAPLPDHPVIVEAGANDGTDTLRLARTTKRPVVHCFEPHPLLYKNLTKIFRNDKMVTCYPLGLGEKIETREFHLSSGGNNASSSVLPPKEHLILNPHIEFNKKIAIEMTSLDAWAEKHGIAEVHALWLDLQGFELSALKGAERLLKGIKVIQTEVNLLEVYENVPLYNEVRSWLIQKGFKIAKVYFPHEDQGDVLFVKK